MNHYYPGFQDGIQTAGGTNIHIFGAICMIFFLIGILALVIWIVMRNKSGMMHHNFHSSKALDLLDERFAKGEIDAAEYEEKKRILRS